METAWLQDCSRQAQLAYANNTMMAKHGEESTRDDVEVIQCVVVEILGGGL